jgi:glycerate-2-kinase
LRKDALSIAEAAYAAIDAENVIRRKIRVEDGQLHIVDRAYPLTGRNVYFVGIGKCAVRAGLLLEQLLGGSLTAGIMLDVSAGTYSDASKLELYVGTHPLPSEANARASARVLEFLSGRSESDLVIMLISGGGSALLSLPEMPMTSIDESDLFKKLTGSGAPIQELNTVRKHISKARGGALAVAAYPAEVVSLAVSDVPGDDLASIASGPTIRDTSTVADAKAALAKYGIDTSRVTFLETEKDEKYFARVSNSLLLASRDALSAMLGEALARGYAARIADTRFSGEAGVIGRSISATLHESPSKSALLYAGESTVTLGASPGKGGRNQEMALATLEEVRSGELILPFASDGHDNTDHAGAISDELSRTHAAEKSLDIREHLEAHDSYLFFTGTSDALVTGLMPSNVADLVIALKA